jgi:hypothetical protein
MTIIETSVVAPAALGKLLLSRLDTEGPPAAI